MTGTCKLCEQTKALRKNSHIIPAFLLKHMVGERDNEVSLTISSAGFNDFFLVRNINEEKVEKILIEQEDVIKPNPYAIDYILCNECENYLGSVEGQCSEIMDKLTDNVVPIKRSLDVSLIKFVMLTIIWRCTVSGFSKFALPKSIENKLRILINKKPNKASFNVQSSIDDLSIFPLSVILRPNLFQPDNTFVFIDKNTSCPYYFCFLKWFVFYSKLKSTKKLPQLILDLKNW
ncbi:MAG: hypothetical protein IPG07_10950 [Crocinitomicaceae bacterium]|nr:hypothetical protein [Crocinitomicaceae bacterium]